MAKEKKTTTEQPKNGAPENLKPTKLTYEQLEQLASQYYAENTGLRQALVEAKKKLDESTDLIKSLKENDMWGRADWLWRIITTEGTSDIFGEDFCRKSAVEFKELIDSMKLMDNPAKEKSEK